MVVPLKNADMLLPKPDKCLKRGGGVVLKDAGWLQQLAARISG